MNCRAFILPQFVLFAIITTSSGCGWRGSQTDGVEEEDIEVADEGPAAAVVTTPAPTVRPHVGEPRAGDRFSLLKTVTQMLQQPTPDGWVTSRSAVEMLLTLTVEEIHGADPAQPGLDPRSGQKRLQVAWQQLRFMQEL